MRVRIGPYSPWYDPVRLLSPLERVLGHEKFERVLEGFENSPLGSFLKRRSNRYRRRVSVRIDGYDCWNLDETLAFIIAPALRKLKEAKHGAALVDDEDVPESLASDSSDERTFEKWAYILDEMIWAMDQLVDNKDDQFYSGSTDFVEVPVKLGGEELVELRESPRSTFKIDLEGLRAYNDRISNGLCLFGKYMRALWD